MGCIAILVGMALGLGPAVCQRERGETMARDETLGQPTSKLCPETERSIEGIGRDPSVRLQEEFRQV